MEMIRKFCLCRFVKTGLPLPLETLLPLLLYLAAIFSTSEHGINSVCLLKKILRHCFNKAHVFFGQTLSSRILVTKNSSKEKPYLDFITCAVVRSNCTAQSFINS